MVHIEFSVSCVMPLEDPSLATKTAVVLYLSMGLVGVFFWGTQGNRDLPRLRSSVTAFLFKNCPGQLLQNSQGQFSHKIGTDKFRSQTSHEMIYS